jgi:periplasmic divalent cation tolerance protein
LERFVAVTEFVVVFISTPAEQGQSLARALVERRLAACVNVVASEPSFYWWEGAVEERREAVLIAKTRGAAVRHIAEALKELHPDKNFELIALPVEDGSPSYLTWLAESVELPDEEELYFH